MNQETVTLIAPAVWASAIVNGDYSGLDESDFAAIAAFLAREGVGECLDCREYGFAWRHDATPEIPLGAECCEYVFRIESAS